MDNITITFPKDLNVSVQVGDTAYFTDDPAGEEIKKIGVITAITSNSISVDTPSSADRPTASSFILFSKTNKVNISGLRGYYAEVQFRNESTDKIELFSVGSEIFESSK